MWQKLQNWVLGLVGLVNQLVGVFSWSGAFDSVLGWLTFHPVVPPLLTVLGTVLVCRWYQRVGGPAIARAWIATRERARDVFMALVAGWRHEQASLAHHVRTRSNATPRFQVGHYALWRTGASVNRPGRAHRRPGEAHGSELCVAGSTLLQRLVSDPLNLVPD